MKNKKAYITTMICLVCVLILLLLLFLHLKQNDLFNNNEYIANAEDHYSTQNFVFTETDDNQWEFSIGSLSGVKTTTSFTLDKDSLIALDVSCFVSTGIFKLVFVDVENSEILAVLCDNSNSSSLNNFQLKQGEYVIKAVGKKATAAGYFTITISE